MDGCDIEESNGNSDEEESYNDRSARALKTVYGIVAGIDENGQIEVNEVQK